MPKAPCRRRGKARDRPQCRAAKTRPSPPPIPEAKDVPEVQYTTKVRNRAGRNFRRSNWPGRCQKIKRVNGELTYKDALKSKRLVQEMARDRQRVVFYGEDVRLTMVARFQSDQRTAWKAFGRNRVFNTPISGPICGTGWRAAARRRLRPVVELMYLIFA